MFPSSSMDQNLTELQKRTHPVGGVSLPLSSVLVNSPLNPSETLTSGIRFLDPGASHTRDGSPRDSASDGGAPRRRAVAVVPPRQIGSHHGEG